MKILLSFIFIFLKRKEGRRKGKGDNTEMWTRRQREGKMGSRRKNYNYLHLENKTITHLRRKSKQCWLIQTL